MEITVNETFETSGKIVNYFWGDFNHVVIELTTGEILDCLVSAYNMKRVTKKLLELTKPLWTESTIGLATNEIRLVNNKNQTANYKQYPKTTRH